MILTLKKIPRLIINIFKTDPNIFFINKLDKHIIIE